MDEVDKLRRTLKSGEHSGADLMRAWCLLGQQRDELNRLKTLAERICRYDWSDNDEDAVAEIEALRRAISP